MPKDKSSLSSILCKLAKDNNEFTTDGKVLYCIVCEKNVKITDSGHSNSRFNEHIKSGKHIRSRQIKIRNRQTLIPHSLRIAEEKSLAQNEFIADLTKSFIESDIPPQKLSEPSFISFLEKYTGNVLPHRTTLHKNYIQPIYSKTINKIIEIIGESDVYFIADETTDTCNRYVLNILVGTLNGKPVKPMLLSTSFLEKTNHSTIQQSFIDSCNMLWPIHCEYDKVKLVVTDQATYMIKAFNNLKNIFLNLNHITCIVHALNRVCESIREKYFEVNQFILNMKKILKKSPYKQNLFRESTGLSLPPNPVITRWNTWLKTAYYYIKNF